MRAQNVAQTHCARARAAGKYLFLKTKTLQVEICQNFWHKNRESEEIELKIAAMDKEGSAVAADMEDPLYLLVLYVDRGGSSIK